jgi:hypothetical protein
MQLVTMTPGVQSEAEENSIGLPMYHVIINGSTDNMVGQVTYYLDGGLNMTGVRDTGNVIPNPDALDQFNIQTNNFSAEYGRTGAGRRLGAHQVRYKHGPWIGLLSSTRKRTSMRPVTCNQADRLCIATALARPWVALSLKDKIFFFGSYAGLREIDPVNFNTVVPDALQRVGNFSENLPTTTPVTASGVRHHSERGRQGQRQLRRFVLCVRPGHPPADCGQSRGPGSELHGRVGPGRRGSAESTRLYRCPRKLGRVHTNAVLR